MTTDRTEELTADVDRARARWETAEPGKAKDRAYQALAAVKTTLRNYRAP